MSGYIGSKASVTLVDGYTQAEADAEFVQDPNGAITVSGSNVGIGTSSPEGKLHVYSDNVGTPSADADDFIIEKAGDTGLSILSTTTGRIYFGDASSNDQGSIRYVHSDNSMRFETDSAERMRINSSGNLLFNGNGVVSVQSASSNMYIGGGIYQPSMAWIESGSLTGFKVNGSERMRIDSSGNLLVGTTDASPYGAPADGFIVAISDGTKYAMNLGANGTSNMTVIRFNNPNGGVGGITTSGNSTVYYTSSDYRLKTDAQPMTGASARVQALNPVNFEWLSDGSRVDGFLAHEAQEVVPECATGTKDAMMDEEYEVTPAVLDDDGNETTEAVMGTRSVPDYQGIDQSKLVPLLTAALQEALTKIDDMETRLAALEGN